MSIIHYIIPKLPLDIPKLNNFVSNIDNANHDERSEDTHYYWITDKSTRGFDITIEEDVIEVRNTVLSNLYDYELTNKIVDEILKLTNGIIVDEEEEILKNFPLFDTNRIMETELNDCGIIQTLSKEGKDITIFGPTRKVHFGSRLYNTFNNLNNQQLKDKIFEIILLVNYQLPEFESGNVIQVVNTDEETKIMKLLTNNTDYIIDKYDYILLNKLDEKPIMITNEILNSMLPSNWILVDEFTIVAPITSKTEWEKLLESAKQYDQFDSFGN